MASSIGSPAAGADDDAQTPKRVLILHSFGRNFGSFTEVATNFQEELARLSPQPVDFSEVTLETARFADTATDHALVTYLNSLFKDRPMDLIVSVGGPAARFLISHREELAAPTPLLAAGVERRWLTEMSELKNATAVPLVLDLPAVIENILRLCPDTKDIVVVLGGSPLSKFWLAESERDLSPFSNRVRFTWGNKWSLEEMRKRLAALPPRSVILFIELTVDDAGIPHPQHDAVEKLHAVANAPMFGVHESRLGRGIVGGPLIPEAEAGRRAAAAALRILKGEAPASFETPLVTAGNPVYDFRELERWGISETLLPPGSTVRFRPTSMWDQYRGTILTGLVIVGLQSALIGGLLLQRSRRRVAEEEIRALSRRLLTAHEDERRHLARELHDDLSQRLARCAIDAARVEQSIPAPTETASAKSLREDLKRLSDDVHALAYQLHPSVLDELGLKEALEIECERFSGKELIAAELTNFEAPSQLRPDIAVCFFRIAQGALRNVARHSGASRVSLSVIPHHGGLRMTVSDNGTGFDPGKPREHPSLGHASMRERAGLVHGTLEIESAPGCGTTVGVWVPLKGGPS